MDQEGREDEHGGPTDGVLLRLAKGTGPLTKGPVSLTVSSVPTHCESERSERRRERERERERKLRRSLNRIPNSAAGQTEAVGGREGVRRRRSREGGGEEGQRQSKTAAVASASGREDAGERLGGWPGRLEEKVLKALLILRHQLWRTIPIPKGARPREGGRRLALSLSLPLSLSDCRWVFSRSHLPNYQVM